MTERAQSFLHAFEALADSERHEVATEILRRTSLVDSGFPEDAALVSAADQIFLELDRRESRE